MAKVVLENLGKTYAAGMNAVSGVNLEIEDGEFVVLVGPSGCGKSTLLRMVAGLERISEGTVKIGDRKVNDLEPAERDIAMVFQNYALYPHMSVRQNLSYGLKNRHVPQDEIDRRVEEVSTMLEIKPFLDRKPKALSGGQRQRVAMGRSIVRKPQIFLFDEPLSNLDAKLRNQMRLEIKSLQKRLGVTSIYVTHDQVEAMTMADRIVILNDGRVEQIGTPDEVYNSPASSFVSSFMGAPPMNLMKGHLEKGEFVFETGEKLKVSHKGEGEVLMGLRPEVVKISEKGPLSFELMQIEKLGDHKLMHGLVGGQKFSLNSREQEDLPLGTYQISYPADRLCLFDVETGKRL